MTAIENDDLVSCGTIVRQRHDFGERKTIITRSTVSGTKIAAGRLDVAFRRSEIVAVKIAAGDIAGVAVPPMPISHCRPAPGERAKEHTRAAAGHVGRVSPVASPCCSIAALIAVLTSLISPMVCVIALTAWTEILALSCISATLVPISSLAFRGLVCEAFDLRGHHREAAACFARPRRLDSRVERKQVSMFGDR